MAQQQILSAKEVASTCSTDARTFRKFLRDTLPKDQQPGQGKRYAFSKTEARELKKRYAAWAAGKQVKEAEVEEVETEELDEVEDFEPSEEELEEIDFDSEHISTDGDRVGKE